jgi:RNA polymerase sigma factor (sigma-70 family)
MRSRAGFDFETLVELYYQPVFTFAVRLCGKLDHALELTQHTFCLALSRQSYLEGKGKATGWLFTLLFREFLKEKAFKKEPKPFSARDAEQSKPQPAFILDALEKVREDLREPLFLFYTKDFSCSQISDYLGISIEAVLKRLSQGRDELNLALAYSGRKRSPSRNFCR